MLFAKRKALGMTIEDVASETGFSERTLSNYENGVTSPSVDNANRILSVLNLTLTVVEFNEVTTNTHIIPSNKVNDLIELVSEFIKNYDKLTKR